MYYIEHDNGVRGQHVISDGYATFADAQTEAAAMENIGIIVYSIGEVAL